MRSGREVKLAEVLRCSIIDEFIERQIVRQVDELAFAGFDNIVAFLRDKVGLAPIWGSADYKATKQAIAFRNLIVHNRGQVNERFLAETGLSLRVGETVCMWTKDAVGFCEQIVRIAEQIDVAATTKFGPLD